MTAGHEFLHFDDLHTPSFARRHSGRRPFGESYGLPSYPSTGNSRPLHDSDSYAVDGERSRGRIRFRISREAAAGEVLLLVPPVGACVAGPVLGRRVSQLRALALVDRAV